MASGQWGRTMVTIDGCKLLVDHGEAQGVGVTKLPKLRGVDALPTELASMAERGLALAATPYMDVRGHASAQGFAPPSMRAPLHLTPRRRGGSPHPTARHHEHARMPSICFTLHSITSV